MRWRPGSAFKKKLQGVFWIYLTDNFVINGPNHFRTLEPPLKCEFFPIAMDNYHRVKEFRAENRVQEYREKLDRREKGFFAECGGRVVGSVWATVNKTGAPTVVRTWMKLGPNEALVHDVVTNEDFRGKGVGAFMVSRISSVLLNELRASKIVIDVNVRNRASLRMMEKLGLQINQRTLSISAFGRLISHWVLRQYRSGCLVSDSGFHSCTPSDL